MNFDLFWWCSNKKFVYNLIDRVIWNDLVVVLCIMVLRKINIFTGEFFCIRFCVLQIALVFDLVTFPLQFIFIEG